jgi:predicted small lipoprotein YifL
MKKFLYLTVIIFGLSALTACGQKGPLFHPKSASDEAAAIQKAAMSGTLEENALDQDDSEGIKKQGDIEQ